MGYGSNRTRGLHRAVCEIVLHDVTGSRVFSWLQYCNPAEREIVKEKLSQVQRITGKNMVRVSALVSRGRSLTRQSSAAAGGSERGKLSKLFHKIKRARHDDQRLAPAAG